MIASRQFTQFMFLKVMRAQVAIAGRGAKIFWLLKKAHTHPTHIISFFCCRMR